mmetsp:Transcript_8763/g.23469  ORF Transcript_8763/g.23469 Transcript_8763/m.23469 type:complete len:84 (+) Transcript_8763:376-627(+)
MAITAEQMVQMVDQVCDLTTQVNTLAGEAQAAQQREQGLRQELDATIAGGGRPEREGGMGQGQALVSKWAPDPFSGKREEWPV